jgi:hypothetical protein
MPLQTTSGALTVPRSAPFSANTVGNGWISMGISGVGYFANVGNGLGSGIAVDSGGNLYVPTNNANTNAGFIHKFNDTTGNLIFRGDTARGPGVSTNGNIVIRPENYAFTSNGTPAFQFDIISMNANSSTTNTAVIANGPYINASFFISTYGSRADSSNNFYSWYKVIPNNSESQIAVTDANNTLRASIAVQSTLGVLSRIEPKDFNFDPGGNIYVAAQVIGNSYTGNYVIKCTSNGYAFTQQWAKEFDKPIKYVAADNNYCYVSTDFVTPANSGILKLEGNTGNILIAKGSTGGGLALQIDDTGNIYGLGGTVIWKFDSNLDIVFGRRLNPTVSTSGPSGVIGLELTSNHMYASFTGQGTVINYKLPKDGTIPGFGIYKVGTNNVTYQDWISTANIGNIVITNFSGANIIAGGNVVANVNASSSTTTYSFANIFSFREV